MGLPLRIVRPAGPIPSGTVSAQESLMSEKYVLVSCQLAWATTAIFFIRLIERHTDPCDDIVGDIHGNFADSLQ